MIVEPTIDRYFLHQEVERLRAQSGTSERFQWRREGNRIEIRDQPLALDDDPSAVYEFEIDLTPEKHRGNENIRVPVYGAERRDWIRALLVRRCGLSPIKFSIFDIDGLVKKPNRPFFLNAVRVIGQTKIEDLDLLNTALAKGVGNAKTFGFGMLVMKKSESI